MIGLLLSAAMAIQAAAASPAPPTNAASDDKAASPVDPARLAAATRLLETMHVDRQYEAILTPLLPVISRQAFGSLQNDVRVPSKVRNRLSDPATLAAAERTFTTKALEQFRARYAMLGEAAAREYARKFDLPDLVAMQNFYASPTGQRALTMIPELQQKLVPLGMKIGSEAGMAAMKETVETLGLDTQEKKS